ncbi:MAG: hypothetical protein EPO19_04420 [Betaproteobacteria bacterium]|nr:MAG: hypothetical protein EPO19_04420 [Betaproteobacteria bacterium]
MTQLVLQVPESVFASLHQAPDEFGQVRRYRAIALPPSNIPKASWTTNCAMRIDKVVVNASPLLTLFRSGQAGLFPR